MLAAITTELLIVIKFGKGMFPKPFPPHVIVGWSFFIMALIGYAVYKFILYDAFNASPSSPLVVEQTKTTKTEIKTTSKLRERKSRVLYKE